MRVLLTSTPGWGHVNPMLPLARGFAELGADVVFATPASACARLVDDGFQARPAGGTASLSISELLSQHPEIRALPPSEQPDQLFAKLFGLLRTEPMLADLIPIFDQWGPHLVIRDAAEFAAPIAAARASVPCLTHAFGALLPERRVAAIEPELAPLWEAHGLDPAPYGGSYDHPYLDIYPPSMQPQARAHVSETQHLRPAERPVTTTSRPEWQDDSNRPLVYVTFGTVFNDMTTLRTVIDGIRKLDVQMLVTVGPNGHPASLGPQPPHVRVRTYIPQQEVLGRCSAVVSHGGSGTFLAAAAAGLPQICLPQGADQYLNAEACTRSGIGIALPQPASPDQVEQGLARLLDDASFAVTAEEVARTIEQMPSAVSVARVLIERYGQPAAP